MDIIALLIMKNVEQEMQTSDWSLGIGWCLTITNVEPPFYDVDAVLIQLKLVNDFNLYLF